MLMTQKRSRPSTPVRVRSPHSMMIAASKSPSTRGATMISGTPGNCISGGGAASALTTAASFPSALSALAIASCDPIESPSGRACDDRTKRCLARIASTICCICGLFVIVWGRRRALELVEQLLDPILPGDRFVVVEPQFWRAPQAQTGSELTAQKRRGPFERARGVLETLRVAERRVVDACLLQVRAHVHAGERHETDARIVDVARDQ